MKMHILTGGRLRMRRGVYYPSAAREEMVDLPVSCTVLKHRQGTVLFDTGCNPLVATDAETRWGSLARLMQPLMPASETLVAQLPKAGLVASDIDVVVCSHLHPDHCGCNEFFPKATILAQKAEIAAARGENAVGQGYLAIEFDTPNLSEVDGDRDLFGDGRITLLHMPGHTPGMMCVHAVLDRDGAFVLASDAIAVRAHLDERYAPKNTWNKELAVASIDAIARLRATVVFGHDSEQWESIRKGEAYYE